MDSDRYFLWMMGTLIIGTCLVIATIGGVVVWVDNATPPDKPDPQVTTCIARGGVPLQGEGGDWHCVWKGGSQ